MCDNKKQSDLTPNPIYNPTLPSSLFDQPDQLIFPIITRTRVQRPPQALFFVSDVPRKELLINRDMTKDTSITKVRAKPLQPTARPPRKNYPITPQLAGVTKDILVDEKEFTLERWVFEAKQQTKLEKCVFDAEISHVGSKNNKVEIFVGANEDNLSSVNYSFGQSFLIHTGQFFKVLNLENHKIRIEIKYLKKRS